METSMNEFSPKNVEIQLSYDPLDHSRGYLSVNTTQRYLHILALPKQLSCGISVVVFNR